MALGRRCPPVIRAHHVTGAGQKSGILKLVIERNHKRVAYVSLPSIDLFDRRVQHAGRFRGSQCMPAPSRPVAPKAPSRDVMRLADMFLRVLVDGPRVSDRADSLATRPQDAISVGRGARGGAPHYTPLHRPDWTGRGLVALEAPLSEHPSSRGGGDSWGLSGEGGLRTTYTPSPGTGSATHTARHTPT